MPKAQVTIYADNKMAQGLKSSEQSLSGFQKYAEQIGNKLKSALSIAAIGTVAVTTLKKVTAAAKECVNAFTEADKVSRRLAAVWENVGQASGKNARLIDDMAEALEKETFFSSESIKQASLLLAATESLTEDGFDRALQASLDLAAALNEDVTSAAQTLAKAVEAPEEAFRALKSIGVAFTDEEKEQIKILADANKQFEAQELILSKIEERYQGVATAIADTPSGKLDAIRDTLGDIKETFGEGIINSLAPAFDWILKFLQKIQAWTSARVEDKEFYNLLEKTGSYKELANNFSMERLQEALEEQRANYRQILESFTGTNWGSALASKNVSLANIVTRSDGEVRALFERYFGKSENTDELIDSALEDMNEMFRPVISWQKKLLDAIDYQTEFYKLPTPGKATTTTATPAETNEPELTAEDIAEEIAEIIDIPGTQGLQEILNNYGKQSASYTLAVLKDSYNRVAQFYGERFELLTEDEQGYLKEILAGIEVQIADQEKSMQKEDKVLGLLDRIQDNLTEKIGNLFGATSEQSSNFLGSAVSNLTSSFGEAGEVVSTLAQNMATMGPVLGAIATALKYVFEGLAQSIGPVLNDLVEYGIEPLREFGRVIGNLIRPLLEVVMPLVQKSAESLVSVFNTLGAAFAPIIKSISQSIAPIFDQLANTLEFIEPIIEAVAYVLASINGVLSYIGQAIIHFTAVILNWMAGLNLMGWHPFEGLRMTDPGNPGSFSAYMDNVYTDLEASFNNTSAVDNVGTQQAVASASYRGATSVTINIYAEGPIVGDGGMRQFASMIREEFEALDYYGVD